jgi:hypothetical protein
MIILPITEKNILWFTSQEIRKGTERRAPQNRGSSRYMSTGSV